MRLLRAFLLPAVAAAILLSPRGACAQTFYDVQQQLLATGAGAGAEQGFSVAISADGSTALVGGPGQQAGAGAAWVYTQSGGAWTQQGPALVGSGMSGSAEQGYWVALSSDGNTAVVGGPFDTPTEAGTVGAVWVFTRSGGVWSQQGAKLVGSGAAGFAAQGSAVAISGDGNTVAVGGPQDNQGVGATWVFTRSGSTWSQQGAKLVASDAAGLSQQGFALAVSGDGSTILVGGPEDSGTTGATWVFVQSGGVWSQQGFKLLGAGAVGYAGQGFAVALSSDGNTALEGGPYDNGAPATGGTGAVWVFTRSGGVWTAQGAKLVGSGGAGTPGQGYALAVSGDGTTALVGAPFDNGDPTAGGAGAAWAFARSGTVWTQQGKKLVAPGATGNAGQGAAVALSNDGGTALVGAPLNSSAMGATWVYIPASSFNLNQHGMTGSWFDAATSGQGVEVEVYEDLVGPGTGFMQAAWFTYDYTAPGGAASQRWYTFSGSVQTGQPSATLTLYQNSGGNFNAGPATSATAVGSVLFSAADCNHVTMAYTFSDGSGRSGTIPMTRLLPNVTCISSGPETPNADFGYSGNWYDSATPGQGIVFELNSIQPQAWLTWYTYAPDGQSQGAAGQRWYTAQQAYVPGARTVPLTLYETTGGLFDQQTPTPTTVAVGTATATFSSCSTLQLAFSFTGGSSAGTSGTIDMTRVGPVPKDCGP